MLPKKFTICQYACCTKNSASDRLFWKKEIDQQYRFYLATLRAERDTKYLLKEHSDILRRIKNAEATNVELREQIRILDMELYTMYHRNAHDSAVIDGLHMADHEAGQIKHLESQMCRKLDIATVEGEQEDAISKMLKEEVELLKRKNGEDAKLIQLFKPLENQLKQTLQEEELKNHQQAEKFKRDLEKMLIEARNRNSELERIVGEKSSAILWSDEIFCSTILKRQVGQQDVPDIDSSSLDSSQETDRFDVSEEVDIPSVDDLGKNFQQMKEMYCEYVAKKELLDLKNAMNINVIYDCLQQFTETMQHLTNEYLSVFEISTEMEFIKEYLQRLDDMRKKKDVVSNKDPAQTAQRVDQLDIIYNTLLTEKVFLSNLLHYFMSTFKDDFEVHCVVLRKTEELFAKPVDSE